MVFYNGHSRDGGGPDFDPPRLKANQHVHYNWYRKNRTGLKTMIRALRTATERPDVIGLFSCVSSKYFSQAIQEPSPETSLITSDHLLYYTDALESSLGALNALLGMWCEPAFKRALQAQPGSGEAFPTSRASFEARWS